MKKKLKIALNVLSKITSPQNTTYKMIEKISISSMALINLARHSGVKRFEHSKCSKKHPSLSAGDYLLMSLMDIKKFSAPHNEKFSQCKFFNAGTGCELYNEGVGIPTICRKRFLKYNDNKYLKQLDIFLTKHSAYLSSMIKLLGGFNARRDKIGPTKTL